MVPEKKVFRLLVALGRLVERAAALENILHDLVEESDDCRQIGISRLDFLDQVPDRQPERLTAGFLDRPLYGPPPMRELVHQLVQLLVIVTDMFAELLLLFLGQGGKLVVRESLVAILHRRENEAVRRPQEGDPDFLRIVAQLA